MRKAHPGFVHCGEDCIADQTRISIKPGDIKKTLFTCNTVTPVHFRFKKKKEQGTSLRVLSRKAYLRWSSIRQLASSMAVGFAMFLSAILFPVFLVA